MIINNYVLLLAVSAVCYGFAVWLGKKKAKEIIDIANKEAVATERRVSASSEVVTKNIVFMYKQAKDHLDECENLLKKWEPIAPKLDKDTFVCANCGHELEHQKLVGENIVYNERYNYCPECGKKMMWERWQRR